MQTFFKIALGASLFILTPFAQAQELCFRNGSAIIGDPIDISLVWPIDATAPPELLARPKADDVSAQFDDLFSDKSSSACDGGGLVGALNCDVIAPILNQQTSTSRQEESPSTSTEETETAELLEAIDEELGSEPDEADIGKEIGVKLEFRPVYSMTVPPTISFQHTGFTPSFDPAKLTPEAIARADKDIKAYIAKLTATNHQLTADNAAFLANGGTVSPSGVFEAELSPNAALFRPAAFSLPPACVALFSLRMTQAEQAKELDAASRRLKLLEKNKKDYENLPFAERMKDSRTLEKFDINIKRAKSRLSKAAGLYDDTRKRIRNQEISLDAAEHRAKLDAIGTDPEKVKAADMERTGKAVEAYRAYRLHEKQRAAAVEEYQKGLQSFDQKIANAPDESTRIGYQEQRDRFQRAYDSWNDHSRRVTASRYRDLAREFKQNDEDGLGPKSFDELTQRIERTGDKPEDVLENYHAEKISRAKRIAQSDATTLGGTASRARGPGQFLKDAANAYAEEASKANLTTGELVEGLKKVAAGDETAFADQRQFFERFGNYAKGVAKGSAKGVYDGIGLAHDAATLVLEDGEAKAEDLLSALAGDKVSIDYFGDRKTKAFDKALVDATGAVYNLYNKKGINDPDESTQLKAADVWDNPAALDDYLIQRSQALNRRVAGATDAVVNIADKELAEVTRGGETALRKTLDSTGKVVGELADVGVMATLEAAKVASTLSKGVNRLDDVAEVAKATENLVDVAKADVLSDATRTKRLEAFDAPSATDSAPAPPVASPAAKIEPAANLRGANPSPDNAPNPMQPAPPRSDANQLAGATDSARDAARTERFDETLDIPATSGSDKPPVSASAGAKIDPPASPDQLNRKPEAPVDSAPLAQPRRDANRQAGAADSARDAARTERFDETLDIPSNNNSDKTAVIEDDISTPDFLKKDVDSPAGAPSSKPLIKSRPGEGAAAPPRALPDQPAPALAPENNLPILAEPGPLPGPQFASPLKPHPVTDPRKAETYIDPTDLSPAEKWDLGPDERFNNQLLSNFSSENFQKSGSIFASDLTTGDFMLRGQSEIILNDGRKFVLGEPLGPPGGFKRAFKVSGKPQYVDKAISYPAAETKHGLNAAGVDEIVYDSEVGRTLLQQFERGSGDGLVKVTKRQGNPILVDDPFNPDIKAIIVREDNIASPVEIMAPDGSLKTEIVTSAAERFALRASPQATEAEQMTIQLTMRRLNNEGVVWMDQKLGNFDIVPDADALTGQRMVFFDHDAFRIAPGATAAERSANARAAQTVFDSLDKRNLQPYLDLQDRGLLNFNDAIFGKPMPSLATMNVNLGRTEFQRLNNLSNTEFDVVLKQFGQKIGKDIPLLPQKPN